MYVCICVLYIYVLYSDKRLYVYLLFNIIFVYLFMCVCMDVMNLCIYVCMYLCTKGFYFDEGGCLSSYRILLV